MRELIIDNFAGGGGASIGIEQAVGRAVDIAINHSDVAIETHRLNHPDTRHYCQDIYTVDPVEACAGRPVGMVWFSPDCKHFSRAKGGKPVEKSIRDLAWVVIKWASKVRPRVIFLENVEEFQTWGPLDKNNKPCKRRRGETFQKWLEHLTTLGYKYEHRELIAADYGAPTTRKRLFLIARCDGLPIVWPKPTHGEGRALPYRTAAEIIDWSLPTKSIFGRKKPLAENTLKRIAKGLQRFVFESADPFILTYYGPRKEEVEFRGSGINEPLRTQTTENRFGVVTPFLQKYYGQGTGQPVDEPVATLLGQNKFGLVAPVMMTTGHTKTTGRCIHTNSVDEPVRTVLSKNDKAVVSAYLEKSARKGTVPPALGDSLRRGQSPFCSYGGEHVEEVRAFLVKYYGQAVGQSLNGPLHTVTEKHRFGLVTVQGEEYQLVDICLRMLQPSELALAQGFPASYRLAGTKAQCVALIGNSVSPPLAKVLVKANYVESSVAVEVA